MPGSFTPRLADHLRRRGVLTGGKERRPIAAMLSVSASVDSPSRTVRCRCTEIWRTWMREMAGMVEDNLRGR